MAMKYLVLGSVWSDGVYGSPRNNAKTINDNFQELDDRLKAVESASGGTPAGVFTLQSGQNFTPQGG